MRLLYGENLATSKLGLEPHRQVEITATVAPAPIGDFAREDYPSS